MTDVKTLVDQIGNLKARLAPDLETLEGLENQLKALGDNKYSGNLWDASVSSFQRANLNMDKARAKLSPQFLRANTKYSTVVRLTMTAKQIS